ncbi:hypothetical protein GBAR_LOCUS5756, partial [Geodia barretti]
MLCEVQMPRDRRSISRANQRAMPRCGCGIWFITFEKLRTSAAPLCWRRRQPRCPRRRCVPRLPARQGLEWF